MATTDEPDRLGKGKISVTTQKGKQSRRAAAYRKLICPQIKRLPPVQPVLYFLVILFVPLLHLRLRCDAHHVDNIHYANVRIDSSASCAAAPGLLTVIRGDQLVHAVVRLAAPDRLLAVARSLRELIGPVHPVDARIYVVLVACADL